jgi:hypothetical protein
VADSQLEPIKLLADGLSLVYHEARNVRHLIEKGYILPAEWQRLLSSLSKDRINAWRQLQSVRHAARQCSTAHDATAVFIKRFGKNLSDLDILYQNPNWKHAKAWGGHAWRHVTSFVVNLARAIERGEVTAIMDACTNLLRAQHNNNGPLREKIVELDAVIGVSTDAWWLQPEEGA